MNSPAYSKKNDHFFVVGINYKKTDTSVRGKFAINNQQYTALLEKATAGGLTELFVLSTCNRTEMYGIAKQPEDLINLLCSQTVGTVHTFKQKAYYKKDKEAIEHLFAVAAGLDSQILGDYEIVSQIRTAIKFSREAKGIGIFLDKLTNIALQCSKAIKTNTQLSGGTVSVSFAAIQYLRKKLPDIATKKIVLVGLGKIGKSTCKNLIDYLGTTDITLINRTSSKSVALAHKMNLLYAGYDSLLETITTADVVVVATNANCPIIYKNQLRHHQQHQIFIDLSIPNNIDPSIQQLPNVTLINVDDLSKLKDETLQKRIAAIPEAKAIIRQHLLEFETWQLMRRHAPVLKAVKQKLTAMEPCTITPHLPTLFSPKKQIIQKVINSMAKKLHTQNKKGCHYIEAINEYIEASKKL